MIDRTPRYAPSKVLVLYQGKWAILPVTSYASYPPNAHPKGSPIKPEYTALEMKTDGQSQWWGFEKAWINSELRMVVSGFDSRDELRQKWEVCETL